MKQHWLTCSLGLALLAGAAQAAAIQADLASLALFGAPGGTLHFFATLTNPSATDTIYFNGTSATSVSPFLTIDTSPFLISGPHSLSPGQTSALFGIFDVIIDPVAVPGPYVGNTVSLYGGADGGAFAAFEDLADPGFDIIVTGTNTAVPEPAPGAMVAAGSALLVLLARRRRPAEASLGQPGTSIARSSVLPPPHLRATGPQVTHGSQGRSSSSLTGFFWAMPPPTRLNTCCWGPLASPLRNRAALVAAQRRGVDGEGRAAVCLGHSAGAGGWRHAAAGAGTVRGRADCGTAVLVHKWSTPRTPPGTPESHRVAAGELSPLGRLRVPLWHCAPRAIGQQ